MSIGRIFVMSTRRQRNAQGQKLRDSHIFQSAVIKNQITINLDFVVTKKTMMEWIWSDQMFILNY